MADRRPGLNEHRLLRLMKEAVGRCELNLAGRTVLTEAASGAYVVTPVLAAMAGADVCALAAPTAYATTGELIALTAGLARLAGVQERITFAAAKGAARLETADIVTNSGQVRPIDAAMIARLKPDCVIPLMYESWEYRPSDLDLAACKERGIVVAGTNERHPRVDVFSYLGQLAISQLHEAGIAVRGTRLVVLCDNGFGPYIESELRGNGATVALAPELDAGLLRPPADAIVVALRPRDGPVFTADDARLISREAPGIVVVQYWGDADRVALAAEGVPVWPERAPGAGHMGVLPSAVGPEAIVRLQSGGLKVGEVLARGLDVSSPEDLALIQPL
jgi:hypothetical protein